MLVGASDLQTIRGDAKRLNLDAHRRVDRIELRPSEFRIARGLIDNHMDANDCKRVKKVRRIVR